MSANKKIAERIHEILDSSGIPTHWKERANVFAKLFGLTKYESMQILNGCKEAAEHLIHAVAEEFEVDPKSIMPEEG